MNYFVEGLQGSGKNTMVQKLSEKYPEFIEEEQKVENYHEIFMQMWKNNT